MATNNPIGNKDFKAVKSDKDFMQFINEMFCQEGEEVSLKSYHGNIWLVIDGDFVGKIVKCSECWNFDVLLSEGNVTWETDTCPNCGAHFTEIDKVLVSEI